MRNPYVIQRADKSSCPECHGPVDLLIRDNPTSNASSPAFYICWLDQQIFQAGVGHIERGDNDVATARERSTMSSIS
jgi:hypothetical protein